MSGGARLYMKYVTRPVRSTYRDASTSTWWNRVPGARVPLYKRRV